MSDSEGAEEGRVRAFFSEQSREAASFYREVSRLNKLLGLPPDDRPDYSQLLVQRAKEKGEPVGYLDPIGKAVMQARTLADRMIEFNKSDMSLFEVQQRKAALQRKSDLRHQWRVWAEKLVRWGLGVVAAVLIYSGLVEISECLGFIHIPVRDLVTAKN